MVEAGTMGVLVELLNEGCGGGSASGGKRTVAEAVEEEDYGERKRLAMEATGLSVGKSVLTGALRYAKSTIAQEVALQLGVQRDQAFIRDELEMMLAFLMAAHEERDEHKVVKTWVKQVRDLAYDVEDCLQDFAVRLGRPSRWCFLGILVARRRVATRMKELRAKVEDVSQRNVRYQLIKGTRPKPATGAVASVISGATKFGIEEARRQKDKAKVDLSQLINEGNMDLRVISVWGANGLLGQTALVKGEYDNMKRRKRFNLYAWVRIVHPFSALDFLQCIMRQFYQTCFEEPVKTQEQTNIGAQVLKKMGAMKQDELVDAFIRHVNENSYLIVLNDLSTIEDWDAIKEYFPNNNKGSRIIVSTEHGEVASLCAGQESVVSELKQSSIDESIFASYKRWNAEGYSSEVRGKSMMEVADSYFMELIDRSMILPSDDSVGSRKARLVHPGGVVFPSGISKLKALHTLGVVNITRGKAILQDIQRLTRLQKLAVTGIHKKNCQEFCSALAHLTCLESLSVRSQGEAGLHGCLDGLRSPPKNLQSLKLFGSLDKLPKWIAGLHNLVKLRLQFTELTEVQGTIEVLGKLPNLAELYLWYKSFKAEEPCCFATCRDALFPSLTVMSLGYEPGIGSVEFEEGTAPKLELLCFGHSISFSGLSSLPSLKEVQVDEDLNNDDIKDVRSQLTMNSNKPVLKFF
nr:unnamed protein product [Digitaria exilis]